MQLNTPIRGIAPLRAAIRKIRTSPEQLTPVHADCLLLCLLAKQYKAGLSVLEDDIFEVDQPKDLFLYCYYGSGSIVLSGLWPWSPRRLCLLLWLLVQRDDLYWDEEISWGFGASSQCEAMAYPSFLFLDVLLVFDAYWVFFFQAITAPMSQLNAIAVEAYKKYILVSLIQNGQVSFRFAFYTAF
jgi:COP9 signalosome complex subunit 3